MLTINQAELQSMPIVNIPACCLADRDDNLRQAFWGHFPTGRDGPEDVLEPYDPTIPRNRACEMGPRRL